MIEYQRQGDNLINISINIKSAYHKYNENMKNIIAAILIITNRNSIT